MSIWRRKKAWGPTEEQGMRNSTVFFLAVGIVILAACGARGITPDNPPAAITTQASFGPTARNQSTAAAATIVPPTQQLIEQPTAEFNEIGLRNETYTLPQYGRRVTLQNGTYQGKEGVVRLNAAMLPQIALGDLNGDGVEDAAVLIGENGGGSGVFVSLFAVLNWNGQAVQAGSVFIDDRPRINSLRIQEGLIVLDATIHNAEDIMVNPTLAVVETFRYESSGLIFTGYSSGVKGGTQHSIQIEEPVFAAQVNDSIRLKGNMPVAPFENNLRLRVYDLVGTLFYEGPFEVKAEDVGAPAVFDNLVDLSMAPPGWDARIELAELSMKDGAMITMSSVVVVRTGN
jgi:hypothetical protein